MLLESLKPVNTGSQKRVTIGVKNAENIPIHCINDIIVISQMPCTEVIL